MERTSLECRREKTSPTVFDALFEKVWHPAGHKWHKLQIKSVFLENEAHERSDKIHIAARG